MRTSASGVCNEKEVGIFSSQLHVIQKWVLPLDFCIGGLIYSFEYSLQGSRRTAKSVTTKFGFIRSGKERSFGGRLKGVKHKGQPLQVNPFCFDVNALQRMIETFNAFRFFCLLFSSLICIYRNRPFSGLQKETLSEHI